jgi:signal peptidase II
MHSPTTTTETPPPPQAPPRSHVHRYLFWAAAAAIIALDQGTKAIVRANLERGETWPADFPVQIRHVINTGAAFGILQDQTAFLIVMACVGLAAIYLYYRNPPFEHGVVTIAIGMLLGGAAGNLIDRVRLGHVTDFIDFPRWPAFNVADSAITIGVVVIIGAYILWGSSQRYHPPAGEHEPGAPGPPHHGPEPDEDARTDG